MSKTVHFLLFTSLVICFQKSLADECRRTYDPCTCQLTSRKINFRDLNLPAKNYKFTTTGKGATFYYNPCLPFNIGTIVQATLSQQDGASYYKLGDVMSIRYSGDPDTNTLAISYEFNDGIKDRKTHVDVKCDENEDGVFSYIEEQPVLTYKFLLKTKIVCKDAGGGSSGGLSTGSVLVILFFVLLIVYWLGGFVFLKFVRKAEGSETVPNIEFWRDFPLLIRDGIHFCVNGCKTESSYEKI